MPGEDWHGEYFNNRMLAGAPVLLRDDPEIRFDWGEGSPDASVSADNFSVRWTRSLDLKGGTYRFHVRIYGGVRLFVDGQMVVNQWHDADDKLYQVDLPLEPGSHVLRLEYYDYTGPAAVELWWVGLSES